MNIEANLKKDGIEVIAPLDKKSVHALAKTVATKLCQAFPTLGLHPNTLYNEISSLSMYVANMPDGIAEANYFYRNSSIYFRDGMGLAELEQFAIHEFIHHIQAIKDKKNVLIKLGLCDFTEFKVYGMALNEGAVQLMTATAMQEETETVKYYDIEFPTKSVSYYPLLCNLVEQMAQVTGEEVLFDSTIYSNDRFGLKFASLCGDKAFFKVQKNLDTLLYTEEKIIKLQNKLLSSDCTDTQIAKISAQIARLKEKMKETFFDTQNTIVVSYFNTEFTKIITTEDIEAYRVKLYSFKDYIGVSEDYRFFNQFYIHQMAALDEKYEAILNNTYLVATPNNRLKKLFTLVRKLLWKPDVEYLNDTDNKK